MPAPSLADVIRIINEPTAAAPTFGYGREINRTVAIYDLGGGTFDISVVSISDGVFGGNGWRYLPWRRGYGHHHRHGLAGDRLCEGTPDRSASGPHVSPATSRRAEKAKCELSSARETEINLPFIISTGGSEALHLQKTLTREKLEELTIHFVERTIKICQRTMEEANEEIDDVILVGGMTRMPLVQQRVKECFGLEPLKGVHPDEVVALGAAIQGRPDGR